jgi:hypothetical protein
MQRCIKYPAGALAGFDVAGEKGSGPMGKPRRFVGTEQNGF